MEEKKIISEVNKIKKKLETSVVAYTTSIEVAEYIANNEPNYSVSSVLDNYLIIKK